MALNASCRLKTPSFSREIDSLSACVNLRIEAAAHVVCIRKDRSSRVLVIPVCWRRLCKPARALTCCSTLSSEQRKQSQSSSVAGKSKAVHLPSNDHAHDTRIERPKQSSSEEALKTCLVCKHPKLVEDFQATSSSLDGRTDTCRACIAAFLARRSGRDPGHLALSVEESWQQARKCTNCGETKEVRDFGKDLKYKSGLCSACRACMSERATRRPKKPPVTTPLYCGQCDTVKPASDFTKETAKKTGRATYCRECSKAANRERRLMLKLKGAQEYIPRLRKFCSSCKKDKPTTEFYRSVVHIDGFCARCKTCHNPYSLRRKEGDRAGEVADVADED